MKIIDIENWNRKSHYNYFKNLDYPHFSLCANIDITKFYRYIKKNNINFSLSFLYISSKTANGIKEFRYRIKEDRVIEHESVSPSFTLLTSNDTFSFCTTQYFDNFKEFRLNAAKEMEKARDLINLKDEPGRDDLLYVTSIPWVSFTNITHPVNMHPVDSIPRISWGKYYEENAKIKLPLSIQAHHALVDGIHVGQYFETIQKILNNPKEHL